MSVRVDTVGIAIPENRRDFEDGVLRRGMRMRLPGGGFVATGVGGLAWVEASLPKRVNGQNVEPLGVDEVKSAIVALVAEAQALVPCESFEVKEVDRDGVVRSFSAENPKIVRLDLVRDFRLGEPSLLTSVLDGLAAVPQGGRAKVQRFADGKSGRAETLRVGPGAWAATLYDKHCESGGLADKGHLRAEFRLRARQLRSRRVAASGSEIYSLADLDEERGERIRRSWWDLVGFGSWVGASPNIWEALAGTGLSDRGKLFFVGWYMARRDGQDLVVSDKTERKFRQILKRLEIGSGGTRRVRLNYERGCEEFAA